MEPIATAFGKTFHADGCILQIVQDTALVPPQGIYSAADPTPNWLAQDSLTQDAIAAQKMQVAVNIPADANLATADHYTTSGTQAHLIVPIVYRQQVLAVLSLQWKQPCSLREDELVLLHLSAQQVALALNCICCK
jgi:GAF domain-containing protein